MRYMVALTTPGFGVVLSFLLLKSWEKIRQSAWWTPGHTLAAISSGLDRENWQWSLVLWRWKPLEGCQIFLSHGFKKNRTQFHVDTTTVDGQTPANQLRLVVYPIIYRVLYIPGGFLAGFLNHQQLGWPWQLPKKILGMDDQLTPWSWPLAIATDIKTVGTKYKVFTQTTLQQKNSGKKSNTKISLCNNNFDGFFVSLFFGGGKKSSSPKVVGAVKSGALKHIFVIGGALLDRQVGIP